jgi:hypothetical protein
MTAGYSMLGSECVNEPVKYIDKIGRKPLAPILVGELRESWDSAAIVTMIMTHDGPIDGKDGTDSEIPIP